MNKYVIKAFWVVFLLCFFVACKDEEEGPGLWKTNPLEEYTATPINGGAIIHYTIPDDPDLLYIMAEYERNGKLFTEKASVYKNSLKIEGFDTKEEVQVQLYKVNRQGQKSEASSLSFTPLKALIRIAEDSLKMEVTFGGVVASWANPEATPLGTRLTYVDDNGDIQTKELFYSTSKHEEHVFRGFEAVERKFGVSFEDKWGNVSDTTWLTGKPFFETQIPKPYTDFRSSIPYDNASNLDPNKYGFFHLWDNVVNTAFNGWLTSSGNDGLSITIDMGQVVKLSRIVIHGYHVNSPYGQVNFTKWEGWGTKKIDFDKLSDPDYWLDEYSVRNNAFENIPNTYVLPEHTFEDDWQYLGFHSIIRYDQMSPPDQQGIANISQNGSEYLIPLDAEPVRYVRIFVRMVGNSMPPPAGNYFSMGEITFYGDNTVPQE